MNVVEKCFPHDLDMVVFAGDYRNFVDWYQNFPATLTFYLIQLSKTKLFERHERLKNVYKLDERVIAKFRFPAKLVLVSVLPLELKSVMDRLRRSVLWNPRAYFFFIDEDPMGRCLNAITTLEEAWEFNILYATYVCYDDTAAVQYYTFNPFINTTAEAWTVSNVIKDFNINRNHPMTYLKFAANSTSKCTYTVYIIENYRILI